jgi:hypothetical protein
MRKKPLMNANGRNSEQRQASGMYMDSKGGVS